MVWLLFEIIMKLICTEEHPTIKPLKLWRGNFEKMVPKVLDSSCQQTVIYHTLLWARNNTYCIIIPNLKHQKYITPFKYSKIKHKDISRGPVKTILLIINIYLIGSVKIFQSKSIPLLIKSNTNYSTWNVLHYPTLEYYLWLILTSSW